MKFTVHRSGSFELHLAEGNKCGISGTHTFSYEFWFASDELDERQFVVDHHEVDHAIQHWAEAAKYRGSCEQVVVAIGNIVLDHVHGLTLKGLPNLTVRLNGSVTADITVQGIPPDFRDFTPQLEAVRKKR